MQTVGDRLFLGNLNQTDYYNVMAMIKLSVVIPVYRAALYLDELYNRLTETLSEQGETYEIIFVEDCGGDRSWDVIQYLAGKDSCVRGLRMSRNYGQHNALLAGIRAAHGELIATMDDDLQHPPEQLPKLLAELEDNDVVYGPPEQEQHGLLRDMASRITKVVLQGAMGAETARNVSQYRVFRSRLRDAFVDYRSSFVNIDVLLTWATCRFAVVFIHHEPRKHGQSGYTIRKLITHAFNMITGFSTLPLQIASIMGFVFSFFGLMILMVVLVVYFVKGGAVPGFPFLASIISIFSGVQLFALGIIGEYLSRMHFRSMDRPPYLIASSTEYEM